MNNGMNYHRCSPYCNGGETIVGPTGPTHTLKSESIEKVL